tara:strand:+ start:2470 stop:2841 length:372 start_codon:yes stop_codon:yes gene_type:complete
VISIKLKNKTAAKVTKRLKSRARIRKKVKGTEERPRLTVFRSGRHIYAQVIDDVNGRTLASSSTLATKSKANNIEVAKAVGEDVAKKALSKDIKTVVFDRSGYVFHGRIKALADGAREAGLNF